MNTIITLILTIINGLNFEATIEETANHLVIRFFYGGTHLQLTEPNTFLAYHHIDSFDLELPKVFVYLNGDECPMLEVIKAYCNNLQDSPKPIGAIAAKFYIWAKCGDKRGLIPDPILEDSDEYGKLFDEIANPKAEQ